MSKKAEEINYGALALVTSEITVKCQRCKQEFVFRINDDLYLNLFTKTFEFKCPHCGARHTLSLGVDLVKDIENGE